MLDAGSYVGHFVPATFVRAQDRTLKPGKRKVRFAAADHRPGQRDSGGIAVFRGAFHRGMHTHMLHIHLVLRLPGHREIAVRVHLGVGDKVACRPDRAVKNSCVS